MGRSTGTVRELEFGVATVSRWSAKGVWEKLHSVLGVAELEELQLDSTTIKAHPVASGSRKRSEEKKRMPTTGGVSVTRAAD